MQKVCRRDPRLTQNAGNYLLHVILLIRSENRGNQPPVQSSCANSNICYNWYKMVFANSNWCVRGKTWRWADEV